MGRSTPNPTRTPTRTMKRKLVAILLLLIGGAIINIAVAWGLALRSPGNVAMQNRKGESFVRGFGMAEIGSNGIHSYRIVPGFYHDSGDEVMAKVPQEMNLSDPRFHNRMLNSFSSQIGLRGLFEQAYGWPYLSLHQIYAYLNTRVDGNFVEFVESNGAFPWSRLPANQPLPRRLPFAPLWPGFAINTIFYAGILWLLFAAPGFVRRRYRIKRGLCPSCAYPVGESEVCTECGAPKPVRKPT